MLVKEIGMNERMERMYTLMIMYMISNSKVALSNTQIMTFFVENKYTDYFNIQETINDLLQSNKILATSNSRTTNYFITESGKTALNHLEWYIPPAIINDIDDYLDDIIDNY